LRERIALTVAEINSCQYCIALHSVQGEPQGLAESEIQAAGEADSEDPKTAAALHFARNVSSFSSPSWDYALREHPPGVRSAGEAIHVHQTAKRVGNLETENDWRRLCCCPPHD
jgi:AhpD family alkylhydroperoxidase